jgi:hypothetical protein
MRKITPGKQERAVQPHLSDGGVGIDPAVRGKYLVYAAADYPAIFGPDLGTPLVGYSRSVAPDAHFPQQQSSIIIYGEKLGPWEVFHGVDPPELQHIPWYGSGLQEDLSFPDSSNCHDKIQPGQAVTRDGSHACGCFQQLAIRDRILPGTGKKTGRADKQHEAEHGAAIADHFRIPASR